MEKVTPVEVLVNKIYWLRGHKIMMDRDLAELYGVKAIRLREQVSRNKERFPENFMFQLIEDEVDLMVSQNAIPHSRGHLGGFLPYAFTEHGILMLANVLRSRKALRMSIRIIEVFVKLREALQENTEILAKLDELERTTTRHDEEIQKLFAFLREFFNHCNQGQTRIGFKRASEQ